MRKLIGLAALACALVASPASALYQFDDLLGPSGTGAQWMVITGARDTVGDVVGDEALDVSGDLVGQNGSALINTRAVELLNGRTDGTTALTNRDILAMFLVMSDGSANMTVRFSSPLYDAITPDVDVGEEFSKYYALGKTPSELRLLNRETQKAYFANKYRWTQYLLSFSKKTLQGYDTQVGSFIFQHNPSSQYPSIAAQTLTVPFVIANVCYGTASERKLIIRATLRDNGESSSQSDNIVAYNEFEWDGASDANFTGQTIFVPVDAFPINNDPAEYNLTLEIANYTAVRYTTQRYDQYGSTMVPSYWKFDLPSYKYSSAKFERSLPDKFMLSRQSHIAPGLTTVYKKKVDVKKTATVQFPIYMIDPSAVPYTLQIKYPVIYGEDRNSGAVNGPDLPGTTPLPSYRVQAFQPQYLGTSGEFLARVAKRMNASAIDFFRNFSLVSNNVKYDDLNGSARDVMSSIRVDKKIPSGTKTPNSEGVLPLQVTFNLSRNKNQYVNDHWEALVDKWRDGGNVLEDFKQYFSIYLLSHQPQGDNPWNLINELDKDTNNAYDGTDEDGLIKVAIDEENEVITVSFIVMLMDGTRDGSRPALSLVEDKSDSVNEDSTRYIFVRDGVQDGNWSMTFFIAPAEKYDSEVLQSGGTNSTATLGAGSSGGGCEVGLFRGDD